MKGNSCSNLQRALAQVVLVRKNLSVHKVRWTKDHLPQSKLPHWPPERRITSVVLWWTLDTRRRVARSTLMTARRKTLQNMLAYLKKPVNLQRKTPKGQWSKTMILMRDVTRVKQKIRSATARLTSQTLVTLGFIRKLAIQMTTEFPMVPKKTMMARKTTAQLIHNVFSVHFSVHMVMGVMEKSCVGGHSTIKIDKCINVP